MTSTVHPARPSATASRGRFAELLRTLPRRAWRGRESDARWERPALLGILALSAILYVWDLGASGYANSFYSAAVQAGASNWEAFLYGSSDAGNSITVDKPPASLWVMALSVRLFGLSGWSILLPQAVMSVVTVAVVHAIVRRHFAPQAALIAAGVTAVTPIAVVMFRFNNPDALLLLLLTAALYWTVRHVEDGGTRWLAFAGAAIGFAFLTKQLQAFLILPALIAVVLIASPRRLLARIAALGVGLLALLVSAGWWVALVELVPASMRPYVGGSTDDSFLNLTFVYNGLGRLTGSGGAGGGGGGGGGFGGSTGLLRLFNTEFGVQIAWLLPAALILAAVAFVVLRARSRIDPARATVLLFTGTLLVTALAFSFGQGTIHSYYAVALAPSIGALVGIGGWLLWERRAALWARITAAATVLLTAGLAFALASQAAAFLPWLRFAVLVLAVLGAAGILLVPAGRRLQHAAAAIALTAVLAAPVAWSVDSMLTPQTGSTPSAGPALASTGSGFGGAPGGTGRQGFQGFRGGPAGGTMPSRPGAGTGQQPGQAQRGTGGGDSAVSTALIAALRADASRYTWAAAAIGSQSASGYQLRSGEAVMPVGGFTGSDPSPTLAQFEQYVAAGRIHYFIAGGGFGNRGGDSGSSSITSWVESHFTSKTIGGVAVYDLTAPTGSDAS